MLSKQFDTFTLIALKSEDISVYWENQQKKMVCFSSDMSQNTAFVICYEQL